MTLIKKKVAKKKNTNKENINEDIYFNSIGGSGLSVGSIKVNTVNLAHIAYETVSKEIQSTAKVTIKNQLKCLEDEYINTLKKQVEINLICLDVIRDIIIKNQTKRNLLPNITDGLIELKHMYNTIGIIGVYETLKIYQNKLDNIKQAFNRSDIVEFDYIEYDKFGNIYYTKNAEKFIEKIFNDGIHSVLKQFKSKYKLNYSLNVEQIPGESAASKLQQKDEILYPNLVIKDLPLYGNQFIPLGVKTTLEEKVRVAALFDKYLNGGSIAHLNYESTFSKEAAWEKLNWIAQQGLTYSAFTTKIGVCEDNHASVGTKVCTICGKKIMSTYARIVGFYVNTNSWSTARKSEFALRKWE